MAEGIISLSASGLMRGQIYWVSQSDINTNTSTVYASLQVCKDPDYSATSGTFSGSLSVNGENTSGAQYGSVGDWMEICSQSVTVYHDSQGKAAIYIYGDIRGPSGTTLANATCSGGQTVTLDSIPREVTLTSAPNFTDEGNPVIKYSNPAGNGAAGLQAAILSEDGSVAYAGFRNVSKTATSYTFNLTTTERNAIRNAMPNANSMKVKFSLVGTFGNTQFSSSIVRQVSIVNGNPTITPSVSEANSAIASLTGNSTTMIRYVSNGKVSMAVSALKGASIVSKRIVCGSQVIEGTSGTFYGVETGTFVFEAVDSRGNFTQKRIDRSIIAYVIPSCNISPNAPDTAGKFTFKVSGNYFNGSFGAVSNTLTVQYRYKSTGNYSAWTNMTPVISGNTYTASANFSELDYRTTYTFQARVIDRIQTTTTEEKPMRSKPVFDWGPNDMNINGDLNVNGTLSINGLPLNVYGIGDIYITTNSASPASIFGGTWQQIQGRFLLAAGGGYTAGNTGGTATHTLTADQIPPHKHTMNADSAMYNLKSDAVVSWGGETNFWPIPYSNTATSDVYSNATGGGAAHNNMPPYLVVYIWKRVT